MFVKMANLVLLSRGKNILSKDFKYYSPGTGRLDRDRFVELYTEPLSTFLTLTNGQTRSRTNTLTRNRYDLLNTRRSSRLQTALIYDLLVRQVDTDTRTR